MRTLRRINFHSLSLETRYEHNVCHDENLNFVNQLTVIQSITPNFHSPQNDVSPANREVTPESVSIWCQEYNISSFIETSAKKSKNIVEAFKLAVQQWQVLEKSTERALRAHGETIDLTQGVNLQSADKSCCSSNSISNPNSPQTRRHEVFKWIVIRSSLNVMTKWKIDL